MIFSLRLKVLVSVSSCSENGRLFQALGPLIHCVPKNDAKIQIIITMAHLISINYPLSSFNYRLSGTNFVNFNKIHRMVSQQQPFKNGT